VKRRIDLKICNESSQHRLFDTRRLRTFPDDGRRTTDDGRRTTDDGRRTTERTQ